MRTLGIRKNPNASFVRKITCGKVMYVIASFNLPPIMAMSNIVNKECLWIVV